nr:hypothetical protein [Tanacetum cinerariifolium]
MGVFVDHYIILGFPSGVEGPKVSIEEIKKAYRIKALELHPDKRGDHPNAVTDFQQLQASYEILKDENTRKVFDDDLMIRVKQQQLLQQQQQRKMQEEQYHFELKIKRRRMVPDPVKNNYFSKRISGLLARRMADYEESNRRMMAEVEQRKPRKIMSDFEERKRRKIKMMSEIVW